MHYLWIVFDTLTWLLLYLFTIATSCFRLAAAFTFQTPPSKNHCPLTSSSHCHHLLFIVTSSSLLLNAANHPSCMIMHCHHHCIACLPHHLLVDAVKQPTKTVVLFFIAISSLGNTTSLQSLSCTIIVHHFFIAMHSCHCHASQVPLSLVQDVFFAISLLMHAANLPYSHCHMLPLSSLLSLH